MYISETTIWFFIGLVVGMIEGLVIMYNIMKD